MSPKPRTLKYAEALEAVEQRVVDALPEIIDALIGRAKDGDLKAAVYLADRILGRTAGAKIAPADDREAPYDRSRLRAGSGKSGKRTTTCKRFFAGSGARRGA